MSIFHLFSEPEKKINNFKFLKKKEESRLVLTMVPEVSELYYAYKLDVRVRLPSKISTIFEQRQRYKYIYVYKN